MSKTTNKFSPEVRYRAVRLVLDNEGQHGSRWQAIVSISAKIGCSAHTLNEWVKRSEVDSGARAGVPTEIRAADEFRDKTSRPNELWRTNFTYLKVIGWGWFYLSTILDDYSRYIIAWKLCTTMKAADVTDTLELALQASGCDQATVVRKPRLLSDNGSSYVAADLADYLEDKGMDHVRGAPLHPQTQGKIERWHQTMKNRVLLENYFLPGDLERQIGAFVDHYNNHRYHESMTNLTPADVYHGRGAKILKMREEIKKQTIRKRRLQHQAAAA